MHAQIIREEVFRGGVTGEVNITQLKIHLIDNCWPVQQSAMRFDNIENLLETHEWDDTMEDRVRSLEKRIAATNKIEPLILLREEGIDAYIIDGWHRMAIIYAFFRRQPITPDIIPFPAYWVTRQLCAQFPIERPGVVPLRRASK